jgi:hypothetical protein
VVILQVASKCGETKGRGTLMRDGDQPHDAKSIARITRFPEPVIERALSVLSSREVGWLETVEIKGNAEIPQEGAGKPQEGATIPQSPAAIPHPTDYGTEGNGRNGREHICADAHQRFQEPSEAELETHGAKIGLPQSEVSAFTAYYQSNGWKVGRNKMKSWQAAMVGWKNRYQERRASQSRPFIGGGLGNQQKALSLLEKEVDNL